VTKSRMEYIHGDDPQTCRECADIRQRAAEEFVAFGAGAWKARDDGHVDYVSPWVERPEDFPVTESWPLERK